MAKEGVVRSGLIGCGSFADIIAAEIRLCKKAELVTCFDPIPESRERCSQTFGCEKENSFEDLIARKDIDAVFILSPNAYHAEQTVRAAQKGKHVFVEKPIANTIPDGKKMIEACDKAGVVLMVGHYRRRNAGNRKVKELIEQGAIGDPVMIEANVSNHLGLELTPDKFRWRGDDSGCPAGSLMTMGIHYVDIFNYTFGPIKSVSAIFNKLFVKADVEDINATVCRFESGILGYLGTNYVSRKANWMYVYGTKGNLQLTVSLPDVPFDQHLKANMEQSRYTKLVLFDKGDEPKQIPLAQIDPLGEEVEEFARCVQTGGHPETDGPGGLANLAYVRAAIDSARTGKQTKLEVS
jgi:predicted dehydrogenase